MAQEKVDDGFLRAFKDNFKETAIDGLSGGLAGFVTTFLFHPLENIRTRLQTYETSQDEEEKIDNVSLTITFFYSIIDLLAVLDIQLSDTSHHNSANVTKARFTSSRLLVPTGNLTLPV